MKAKPWNTTFKKSSLQWPVSQSSPFGVSCWPWESDHVHF
jgi:hypothetical protein